MILASAIRFKNLGTYTGKRHNLIIQRLKEAIPMAEFYEAEQGFINEKGLFLTREEAMLDAIGSNQLLKDNLGTILISEDLW